MSRKVRFYSISVLIVRETEKYVAKIKIFGRIAPRISISIITAREITFIYKLNSAASLLAPAH